jgi:periplasmic copper chaperone A
MMAMAMRRVCAPLIFAALLAACGPAPSHKAPSAPAPAAQAVAGVSVTDARASPTPGGTTTSAGYLTISNSGGADDRLISASSPRAGAVQLHTMEMDGAVMRMRPIEGGVAVPAGGTVAFAPGGMHLMFLDVATPFAEGETIPVTLNFEHAGAVNVNFPVSRTEMAH